MHKTSNKALNNTKRGIEKMNWHLWQRGVRPPVQEDQERPYQRLYITFFIVAVIAFVTMAFHWWEKKNLGEAGSATLLAFASFGTSAVVAFLFGLPSSRQSNKSVSGNYIIEANHNLKQISDWLTKIIIGVSLFQWRNIFAGIDSVAAAFSKTFGEGTHLGYAVGIIGFFLPFGFLFSYVTTRLILTRAIAEADQAEEGLEQRMDNISADINQHSRIDLFVDACKERRHKKDFHQTQPLIDFALRLAPNNECVLLEKALLLATEKQQYGEAAETLAKLIKIKPDSAVGLYNYGCYLIQHHYVEEKKTDKPMPKAVARQVVSSWQKAFALLPELKQFAGSDKDVIEFVRKEPEINDLIETSPAPGL